MKIDIDLPWGGKLHFEREPISEETRYTVQMGIGLFGFMAFILILLWMFK